MELTMSSKSHIRIEGTEMENDLMHFNIDISEEVRYHHHHQHKKDAERALDSNGKSRNPGGGLGNRIKEGAVSFGEPNKFYAESHDIGQSEHTRHILGRDRHKESTKSRKHFHHRTYKIARNRDEESPQGNATWCKTPTHEFDSSEMAYERYYPPELQPRREAIRQPGYEPDFRPHYPQETNNLRAQAYADPGYAYAHEYYQNVPKQYHESHCSPHPHREHLSYSKVTPVGPRTSPSYRDFNPHSEAPSHDVFSGEYLVSSTSIPVYRPPWEQRTRLQVKGTVPHGYPLNYNSPCYNSSNSYHDLRKCGKIYGNIDPHGPVYNNDVNYKERAPGGTPREFSGYDYYDARHAPRTHPPGKPSPKSASKYYETYDNPTYTDGQGPIKISHKYYRGEADAEDECENAPIEQFDRYYNNSEAMLEQSDSFNYKKKNSSPKRDKNHDKECQDSPINSLDIFFKEEIPYRKPHYNERKKQQLRRETPSKKYHYFVDIPQRIKYSSDYTPNHQESKKIAKSADFVKLKYYGEGLEVPHKICKYQMTESPIVHFSPVEIPYRRRERIHPSQHKKKSAHKCLDAGCDTLPALSVSKLTVNNESHHSVGPQSCASNKYSHDDRRHPDRKGLKDRISGLVKKSKLSLTRSNLFKSKSLVLKGYKPVNCFNFTSMGCGMSTKNERKIQEERSFSGAEQNFMRKPLDYQCRYPTGYRGQGQEDYGRKYQEYSMYNVLNSSERSRVNSAQNEHGHSKYSEPCRAASDSSLDDCSICDKYKKYNKSSYSDSGSGNFDDNCSANFSNSSSYNWGDNCTDNCSDKCPTHNCCTSCKCDDNEFKETCDPAKPSQINICLTIRTVDGNLVEQPRVTSSESKCHSHCESTAACSVNSQPTCQVRVCEPPSPAQSCLKSASSKCQKGCASKAHRDEPRGGCGENSFKNVRPKSRGSGYSSQNQSTSFPSKGQKKKTSMNTSGCPLNKTCPPGNKGGKFSRPSKNGSSQNSCDVGTAIQKQDKSPCVQPLRPTIRPCNEAQARSQRKRVVLNTNSDSTLVDSDKSESKRAKGCTRCTALKRGSPTNPSKGSGSGRNTRSSYTAKSKHKNSATSLSSCSSKKSSSSCEKKPKQSPEEYVCYPSPHLVDNTCPGGNFSMLSSYNTPGPVQCGDLCCPKLVAEWDQECCRRKNPIEDLKQELLKNMRSEQQLDAQTGALRSPSHMMFLPSVHDAPCQQNACPFPYWSPSPVVSWPPCPTLQAPCSF
ncbi:uncharacterized protein LOC111069278 [Drosophila obscura]|uniref:uncharacterized protein LOC111069278 n=1 Tax=Drosophila obscura TaxID=7282 RepID=UPI001BB17317|nr:uncharacterized protein LOC111069278 [Drosophila obscura]